MKTMDIMYADLTADAQKEFDEIFGSPEDFNHDVSPLCVYTSETE